MGTEPRRGEDRRGGEPPPPTPPWPFRSPTTSGAESLGEAAVSRGGRTLGTRVWTLSQARQCVGHLWPGWRTPRMQAKAAILIPPPKPGGQNWLGLGGPKGPSGRVKKSSRLCFLDSQQRKPSKIQQNIC